MKDIDIKLIKQKKLLVIKDSLTKINQGGKPKRDVKESGGKRIY